MTFRMPRLSVSPAIACAAFAVAGIGTAATSHAGLIASDSFATTTDGAGGTYSTAFGGSSGRLYGQNPSAGNTGFTGAWDNSPSTSTNDLAAQTASLSHALVKGPTASGRATTAGGASDRTVFRAFTSVPASTTYAFSGVISNDDTNSRARFGVGQTGSYSAVSATGVIVGTSGSNINVYIDGASTTLLSNYSVSETYFVLVDLVNNTTGSDTINARIYASGATNLATPTGSVSGLSGEISADLTHLVFTKDNTDGTGFKFDEFRFGTSVTDVVVPEPTSLALVGLAATLLRRRR